MRLYQEINDKSALGEVYSSMGAWYVNVEDYQNAILNYSKALQAFDDMDARALYAETLTDIGNVYYNDNQFGRARDYYQQSLTIQQEINDKAGQVYNHINLGLINLYVDMNYVLAEQNMQRALRIAEETGSIYYIAYCSSSLAGLFSNRGLSNEAYAHYQKALSIYRETENRKEEAQTLLNLAYHLLSRGEFSRASALFEESLLIGEGTSNRNLISSAYAGMGEINRLTGEFSKSLDIFNKSLIISQEMKNEWEMASTFINLGNTYNALSEFQTAIAYYLKADSLYLKVGSELNRATAINNIGTIYYYQGDYTKALGQFRQAFPIILMTGVESDFQALLEANIAETFYESKQYDSASYWLDTALERARRFENKHRLASTLIIAGKLHFSLGEFEKSLVVFNEAENILKETGQRDMLTELYYQRGKLHYTSHHADLAAKDLLEAISISTTIGYDKFLWGSLYQLALIHDQEGNDDKCIRILKESVGILETMSTKIAGGEEARKIFEANETRLNVYELLISRLIRTGNVDEALLYMEKANNSNLQMKFGTIQRTYADENVNNAILKEKVLKANVNKVDEALIKERSKPEGFQNQGFILKLEQVKRVAEEEYNVFIRKTITTYPDLRNYFSNSVNPNEFSSIYRSIPEEMAVLLYLMGDHDLYVFIATQDTVFANVLELEKSTLESKIEDIYTLISRPSFKTHERGTRPLVTADEAADNETKFRTLSSDLYSILISPFYEWIADKQNLVIIPNGALNYLPFQVLGKSSGNGFTYLIEEFRISYTNQMRLITDQQPGSSPKIVAIGNADNSLPFAETEVVEIKNMFPDALVYVKNEATRDKVYNIPDSYNVLHFATHGVMDFNDFENSYLVLASRPGLNDDGRLRIEDIYQIGNLNRYHMVTLSACETAVSFELIEGWPVATATAFLETGVTTVIASLWSVDDLATQVLMKKFYEKLKTRGKLDAISESQREMIATPSYAHPYYWAPFLLVGNWK